MSEHHPSCTPNDKSLVWHCHQCGLNESAADIEEQLEAEQEKVTRESKDWTAKSVGDLGGEDFYAAQAIADAHNAELATWRQTSLALVAELNQLGKDIDQLDKRYRLASLKLDKQLAAEREKREQAERELHQGRLDAESRIMIENQQLREQLLGSFHAEYEAVEALRKIRDDESLTEFEINRIADAALEKVIEK